MLLLFSFDSRQNKTGAGNTVCPLCFHRDVHAVCLWDDKGPAKIHQALKEDILDFIKQAQAVRPEPEIFVPASLIWCSHISPFVVLILSVLINS